MKSETSFIDFRHVIICEDVRQEIGGTATLVGVNSGRMEIDGFPASVSVAFYAIGIPEKMGTFDVEFRVLSPSDEVLVEDNLGESTIDDLDGELIIVAKFDGVPLTEAGAYELQFRTGSDLWETAREMKFRARQD